MVAEVCRKPMTGSADGDYAHGSGVVYRYSTDTGKLVTEVESKLISETDCAG